MIRRAIIPIALVVAGCAAQPARSSVCPRKAMVERCNLYAECCEAFAADVGSRSVDDIRIFILTSSLGWRFMGESLESEKFHRCLK